MPKTTTRSRLTITAATSQSALDLPSVPVTSPELIMVEVYTQMPAGWMPYVAALDANTTLQQLRTQLQQHTGVRADRQDTHATTYLHNRSTWTTRTCAAPLPSL